MLKCTEINLSDVVRNTEQRYLAKIEGETDLTFGSFAEDGDFYNEGYGYMDCNWWKSSEIQKLWIVEYSEVTHP